MLYFWFATIVIILILYMMPIIISLDMKKDNNNDKITVGIRTLYGLIKFKTEIPFLTITFENGKLVLKYKIEVADKKRSRLFTRFTQFISIEKAKNLLKAYEKIKNKIKPVMIYIAKKIKISNFNLEFGIGTGDAAVTGVLYGMVWIIIGNLLTFSRSYLYIREPRITVVPIFRQVQFCVDFNCIISMKLGHIIYVGIRVLPVFLSGMGE